MIALERCLEICAKYKGAKMEDINNHPQLLLERMKELSANMVELTKERVEVHEAYQKRLYDVMSDGTSFNKAQLIVDNEIPELYKYRRMIESITRVYETMRSHQSYIKSEMNLI